MKQCDRRIGLYVKQEFLIKRFPTDWCEVCLNHLISIMRIDELNEVFKERDVENYIGLNLGQVVRIRTVFSFSESSEDFKCNLLYTP